LENLEKYYHKEENLVARKIAGETIVVPVRYQVADLQSIYTLNELGTFIWDHLNQNKSVGNIVEAICELYEVSMEEAEKDTCEFLQSLESDGMIHQEERPEASRSVTPKA
jgi:hypothetical protein